MTTRKRLTLAAVFVVLLLPIGLTFDHFLQEKGPAYGGKSLNSWVLLLGRRYWEKPPSPELRASAEQAINHLGTNCLPYLIQWISYEPAPSKTAAWMASLVRKLPRSPRLEILELPRKRPADEMRARGARNAFCLLGATASPAIPKLMSIVTNSQDVEVKDRVIQALAGTGAPSLGAMMMLMTNSQDHFSQVFAMYAVVGMGTNMEPVIPQLIACLSNRTCSVPNSALTELSSQSPAFADAWHKLRYRQGVQE